MNDYTIRALLVGSDTFLFTCITKLYEQQTPDEQDIEDTIEENGRGFNSSDARIMSRYAVYIQQELPLCISEMRDARRRIIKYVTQLSNLLTEEDLLL